MFQFVLQCTVDGVHQFLHGGGAVRLVQDQLFQLGVDGVLDVVAAVKGGRGEEGVGLGVGSGGGGVAGHEFLVGLGLIGGGAHRQVAGVHGPFHGGIGAGQEFQVFPGSLLLVFVLGEHDDVGAGGVGSLFGVAGQRCHTQFPAFMGDVGNT